MVEGRKNVLEAILSGYTARYILGTSEFINRNAEELKKVLTLTIECKADELTDLGTFQTNNDCIGVFEMKEGSITDISFDDHLLALDGVGDPGNLGTIIRTADWYGIKHVICSEDCADIYNPKVINSTMGSFTRVNVHYVNLMQFIKKSQIPAIGADLNGVNINDWQTKKPQLLVMGSESHGISAEVSEVLTNKVTIPRIGGAESLNVGIATGILCHHMRFSS